MSLAQINEVAADIGERADDLQREFDALFAGCPAGELRQALHILKTNMIGLRQQARQLHTLMGTARMVGDLPQHYRPQAPAPAPSPAVEVWHPPLPPEQDHRRCQANDLD